MTDETIDAILRFLSHPVTVLLTGIFAATAGTLGVVFKLLDVDTLSSMREFRPRNLAFTTGVVAVVGAIRARAGDAPHDRRHTLGLVFGAVGGLMGLGLLLTDWTGLLARTITS